MRYIHHIMDTKHDSMKRAIHIIERGQYIILGKKSLWILILISNKIDNPPFTEMKEINNFKKN